jgi:hypothetical protein
MCLLRSLVSCALQRQECVCCGRDLILPAPFQECACCGRDLILPAPFRAGPHPNHVLSPRAPRAKARAATFLSLSFLSSPGMCVYIYLCLCVCVFVICRDNLIHGDLHGGNVMVSPKSEIVTVIDAGLVTGVNLVRSLRPCATRLSRILTGMCALHAFLHAPSPLRRMRLHKLSRG